LLIKNKLGCPACSFYKELKMTIEAAKYQYIITVVTETNANTFYALASYYTNEDTSHGKHLTFVRQNEGVVADVYVSPSQTVLVQKKPLQPDMLK